MNTKRQKSTTGLRNWSGDVKEAPEKWSVSRHMLSRWRCWIKLQQPCSLIFFSMVWDESLKVGIEDAWANKTQLSSLKGDRRHSLQRELEIFTKSWWLFVYRCKRLLPINYASSLSHRARYASDSRPASSQQTHRRHRRWLYCRRQPRRPSASCCVCSLPRLRHVPPPVHLPQGRGSVGGRFAANQATDEQGKRAGGAGAGSQLWSGLPRSLLQGRDVAM